MGVKRVKDPGKVYIHGKQYINETIELIKSVSIYGFDNKTATIFNYASLDHTFKISVC